mmetsp:Transcript_12277/g.25518  ORF Transcript_12277/g.25518 Transcript_12277/m.25518 type:complete len:275 (+) Transcript_12277:322-1146(+)
MIPGRHGLQLTRVNGVQKQRFDRVVAVMSQRQFVASQFPGDVVQHPPAQSTAEGAVRLALGSFILHDAVRVLRNDFVSDAYGIEPRYQGRAVVPRLFLIEVHRGDLKSGPSRTIETRSEVHEEAKHRGRILPARNADHDVIALLDHVVLATRLPHGFHETGLEAPRLPRWGEEGRVFLCAVRNVAAAAAAERLSIRSRNNKIRIRTRIHIVDPIPRGSERYGWTKSEAGRRRGGLSSSAGVAAAAVVVETAVRGGGTRCKGSHRRGRGGRRCGG